mmetsp:Transcript_18203/g.41632  ORF Transcript_18203/g.41632 Transcript_18203/m.41632 type:complete len:210 (+) Transcript_18203:232-861(+)
MWVNRKPARLLAAIGLKSSCLRHWCVGGCPLLSRSSVQSLIEVGARAESLEGGPHRLLGGTYDAVRQGKLNLLRLASVVELSELKGVGALAVLRVNNSGADDLDAAGARAVTARHLRIHRVDRAVQGERAVLAVHVVGARARVIAEPDAVVLNITRVLLADFVDVQDLARGLLHVTVLILGMGEWGKDRHGLEVHPEKTSVDYFPQKLK